MHWGWALFFLCWATALCAQTTHQREYWLRLYVKAKAGKKHHLHLELDERRLFSSNQPIQFIAHLHLHRRLSEKMELSAGMTYSKAMGRTEWRPFQEWHLFQPLGPRFRLTQRFRTEQRWLENSREAGGWDWKFRFRARMQLDWRIRHKWALKCNDEIMWQHKDFDQNRTYVGLEYRFSERWSFEMGYLKLWQKRIESMFLDRDIMRCTVFSNL